MVSTTKIGSKVVLLRSDLHARIKRLCFDREIQMKDLIDSIVASILDDEERREELVSKLQDHEE